MITRESAKMTPSELLRLSRERAAEIENTEQMLEAGIERNQEMEREAFYKERTSAMLEAAQAKTVKSQFCNQVKHALLSECLYKLYQDCSVAPLTETDKTIAKTILSKFIHENGGAQTLISNFRRKNIMLSEFARIVDKYYNKVLEANEEKEKECGEGICTNFKVDTGIQDDFLKELQDVDTEDASELIRDRVTDAITDFVDSNTLEKLEYEEIIQTAQDKINATKNEAAAASINTATSRKINEMRLSRKRSVLHSMVESLCSYTMKSEDLQKKYVHEGAIDMDSIVEDTELIYTMLEMVNTTEIVPIDEKFLKTWIQ